MLDKPKIDHYIGVGNTPANIYALKAYCELIEIGWADNTPSLNWEDNAITASLDGAVVGVIIWAKQPWSKSFIIKMGYVSPGFRKNGIYKMLWQEAIKKAKEEKMVEILGATHIDNETMRSVAKSQGRAEYAVMIKFPITQDAA